VIPALALLIPAALLLGLAGLAAFFWSVSHGQYDDLEGAANRILFDDQTDAATGEPGNDSSCEARHSGPT
jgi:cbb3-type cytochrome oxidase maturation protein